MKLISLILLMLFVGCGEKKGSSMEAKQDTVILSREVIVKHDTLVIMFTRDSVKRPVYEKGEMYMLPGGWEMSKINMFENGKTIDTITRHEIIYY